MIQKANGSFNPSYAPFSFVCRILLLATALVWTGVASAADIDSVILGDTASERQHPITVQGSAKATMLTTTLGAQKKSRPVRILVGEGSCLSTKLAVGSGTTPLLVEIQEIHDRRPQIFGYTVEVNGIEVYFRTYHEVGAGPNHFFVDVPRNLAPDGVIKLTLRNQDQAPVAIGRIWAYGDFARLAQKDGIWRPMGMLAEAQVLVGWVGQPGKQATFAESQNMPKDRDPAAWQELRKFFNEGAPLSPGFQTSCNYLSYNGDDLRSDIDEDIRKAGSNSIQWQYKFMGGDWGGHPSMLNGNGGDFYDIRYSQAVYNPKTKQYSPTWPGSPGGTIWPTAGDPILNRYIMDRSRLTAQMLSERIGLLAAQGVRPTDVCLVGDEGPSFWWQGGYGDFSPEMVSAAARDGVKLDPERLTPAARKWMFDNLTKRFAERCRAIAEGLGRDVIPVDGGKVQLPSTQLADAVYSHPFINQVFPLFDPQLEGWQNGVNDHAWVGGEPLEYVNPSIVDYIASQGSLAMVNLFRPILDIPYLDKLYQWGMGHIACYQEFCGDATTFSQGITGVDERISFPARHYLRQIAGLGFPRMETLTPDGALAGSENLRLSPKMDKTVQLEDPAKPGRLILRVDGKGRPFPGALSVHLDFGRAKKKEQASQVRILAGEEIGSLQPVAEMTADQFSRTTYWPNLCTADFSLENVLKGATGGYVAVELSTTEGALETGLCEVSVRCSWPRQSGQLIGERPNNREMRTRRLYLQERAITERLLARHRAAGGSAKTLADAERLIGEGQPKAARSLLSGAHSLLLPARFAVRGTGQLGPYPIAVAWSDPKAAALVELSRTDAMGAELLIRSDAELTAQIRCGGLKPKKRYALSVEPDDRIRIAANPKGTLVADPDGWVNATCSVGVTSAFAGDGFLASSTGRAPSRILTALCRGKERYEVQDPALALYNPLRIVSATNAVLERRIEGESGPVTKVGPSGGDRVEITLDEAGRAIALRSSFGKASGRIRSFTPPAVHPAPCNGIIELEDGRTFEFMYRVGSFTKFDIPGLKPWARNNAPADYAKTFKPGMALKLTYTPALIAGKCPRLLTVALDAPAPAKP